MKSTQQLSIYRTAQMMQGMIHRTFERLENGEEVDLQRLEEILRLLLNLMNQGPYSLPVNVDKTIQAVMSGCGERRGNLKVLYPKKKRMFLFPNETSSSTNRAG